MLAMEMTWKKLLWCFFMLAAMSIAILIFGPMSSRYADKKFRQGVDKNGTAIKGVITAKKEHKGREIYFRYQYKDKYYINYEDSHFYYELEPGDSVMLKVDSVKPKDSYIIAKW